MGCYAIINRYDPVAPPLRKLAEDPRTLVSSTAEQGQVVQVRD